jgi:MFS transporter, DHA1 family, multidrug resistance protein
VLLSTSPERCCSWQVLVVFFGIQETLCGPPTTGKQSTFLGSWWSIMTAKGVGVAYAMRFMGQLASSLILPIAPLFILSLMSETASVNTMTGLVVGDKLSHHHRQRHLHGAPGRSNRPPPIIIVCSIAASASCISFNGKSPLPGTCWFCRHWWVLPWGASFHLSAHCWRFTYPGQEGAVFGLDNSITSASPVCVPNDGRCRCARRSPCALRFWLPPSFTWRWLSSLRAGCRLQKQFRRLSKAVLL